jgi:phage FluMu gp28-like protein
MADEVTTESVSIPEGEKRDLLDLVKETQLDRGKLPAGLAVPKILLPYQAKWHMDESVVRIAVKSRRIGFSWGSIAAEGTLEAAKQNGGMSQFYMGYNLGMAAENIGDAAKFSEIYGVAVSHISVARERETMQQVDQSGVVGERKQDITRYKITFKSGHVYEALSSAPWNWRGRQGHARIDEAAFHRNLGEVIKGALAFRLWGGRIDVISTHNGEDNDFNLLVRDIEAGKLNWSLHKIDFDQALADGLYQRICLVGGKKWSPELEREFRDQAFADYPDQADANEELLCIPKKGSGVYMPRVLIENCQDNRIPTLRLQKPVEYVTNPDRLDETDAWIRDNLKPIIDSMPNTQRSIYGQDFGRSGDLSVTWVMQEDSPKHWRQSFAFEGRNLPFDVQARIRDYILDNIPHFYHASFDARGNGQSHAEAAMQKKGQFRVSCIMATQQWYAEWFPKYKSMYEGKYFSVVGGEDVITDHRRVILQKGNPTMDPGRDKGSDGGYRHGDSAVAGLMVSHSANQEGQPAAGESVESNQDTYAPSAMSHRRRVSMYRRN